jgi:ATP-dependent Lon protease
VSESPEIPNLLPILPNRETVVFPSMLFPLAIRNDRWIRAIDSVASGHKTLAFFFQAEPVEPLTRESLPAIGCAAAIVRLLRVPDGSVQVLLQGLARVRLQEITTTDPFPIARVEPVEDAVQDSMELEGLVLNLRTQFQKLVSLSPNMPEEMSVAIANIDEPGRLADFIAANIDVPPEDKQALLAELDVNARLRNTTVAINRELEVAEIGSRIQSQIREQMDKNQREFYLREQLKAIQRELGEVDAGEAAVAGLKERIEAANMPEEARREAERELERLNQMSPMAPEASMIRTYLEWMVSIPWAKSTEDKLDLHAAEQVLNEDHYDLEKVKDRILDYLGVRKLKADMRGPILCFVGPPGVGKTSLGQSIARAMERKFSRMSLGGVHDEAEIRGHRRTYIGALPGRIMQSLRRAETNNPVLMLDEVDKLGADWRGDPSSALLEVLDPEQNHTFVDHYLDVPFDLSRVLFICTANVIDTIPPPLRDRMEVIEIPGYTEEQKLQIALRYLLPRQLKENGLGERTGRRGDGETGAELKENGLGEGILEVREDALRRIIREYTREAGVRNLEREIAAVCRRIARRVASGDATQVVVEAGNLPDYLGPSHFHADVAEQEDAVGLVAGLAVTPVGGDILFVEARAMPGQGNLTLTGQLGDVMQESARASLTYARSRAGALGIPEDFHEKTDIHVHVPAGAIPKDGPSAGITMATAIISALSRRPVSHLVGMTGEITLRGRVLPIGGVRDKVLAAHRAGLKTIILPRDNERDLAEVPEGVRSEIRFVPVEHMDEVLAEALLPERREEIITTPDGEPNALAATATEPARNPAGGDQVGKAARPAGRSRS